MVKTKAIVAVLVQLKQHSLELTIILFLMCSNGYIFSGQAFCAYLFFQGLSSTDAQSTSKNVKNNNLWTEVKNNTTYGKQNEKASQIRRAIDREGGRARGKYGHKTLWQWFLKNGGLCSVCYLLCQNSLEEPKHSCLSNTGLVMRNDIQQVCSYHLPCVLLG